MTLSVSPPMFWLSIVVPPSRIPSRVGCSHNQLVRIRPLRAVDRVVIVLVGVLACRESVPQVAALAITTSPSSPSGSRKKMLWTAPKSLMVPSLAVLSISRCRIVANASGEAACRPT